MADLYTPFRNYVKKMLTFQGREKGTAKVLILDNDTVCFLWIRRLMSRRSRFLLRFRRARFLITMVFQSYWESNFLVFLTEKLGSSHEDMKHLIVFIRAGT